MKRNDEQVEAALKSIMNPRVKRFINKASQALFEQSRLAEKAGEEVDCFKRFSDLCELGLARVWDDTPEPERRKLAGQLLAIEALQHANRVAERINKKRMLEKMLEDDSVPDELKEMIRKQLDKNGGEDIKLI